MKTLSPIAKRRYGTIALTVSLTMAVSLSALSIYTLNWRFITFGTPIIIYLFITGIVGRMWGKTTRGSRVNVTGVMRWRRSSHHGR